MRQALLVLALTGCASAASRPDESISRQATVFSGSDLPTIVADRPTAAEIKLDKPSSQVWLAVKEVYLGMQVPVTVENAQAHQLGNADFYRTGKFAGRSMTELVDCGTGITGPKAANFRIYMSLLSTVRGNSDSTTTVKTTFVATGQNMAGGNSTDKIHCASRGNLEELISERIRRTLGMQ